MIRFDPFELDVDAGELRRGAERVRLQAQPLQLLTTMLEQPGGLVTRDVLARRLWPEGTFVDFEHSLNAAVKRLRAALGDDAAAPRFVETLPRRGYRFIAPCAWGDRAAPPGCRTRIAVLPFTERGREPLPPAFADGLTDETVVQLGQLDDSCLDVISRASSAACAHDPRLASDIGVTLGADYLLEGSVRHDGHRARIAAWLVDAPRDIQVWTGVYDRGLDDVLAVQADVAARIARSLATAIPPRRLRPAASFPTRARALPDRAFAIPTPMSGVTNGV